VNYCVTVIFSRIIVKGCFQGSCRLIKSPVTYDEKDRGSLETGKIADMAILSENPYTIPKERLGEIKVTELLLGGKTYESAVSPIFTHIVRGIKNKGNC